MPVAAQSAFASILFDAPDLVIEEQPPDYFPDLNLDQLVTSILTGRSEYELAPLFYTRLTANHTVAYRQDIFRDLERPPVADCITRFAEDMRQVRRELAQFGRLRFLLQRQAWHLTTALSYCAAVHRLATAVETVTISSSGLTAFAGFFRRYRSSPAFHALEAEAASVREQLGGVTYRLRIHGGAVQVSFSQDEPDYAADVGAGFARFQQGPVKSYRSALAAYEEMNHVEEAIATRVAKLYPGVFAALGAFCNRHGRFTSEVVTRFDQEIQFYLAYLEFVGRVRAAGLSMCYPTIEDTTTPARAVDAFDAALADKLISDGRPVAVVCNDISLSGQERIWVVTGPNQGGKTTYARMIGQLHHLAALGLLVPGTQAQLPLPDRIFTHFERGENLADLTGKLDDDLVRIRDILQAATRASLLIINEIFTSTSLEDAVWLATRVLHRVIDMDCLCVCVSFLDELATLSRSTVSMVATVADDDPTRRTFKIIRRPADGRAYADAVAERYGLTARSLSRRLQS
jgi:hypothetical protein